MLGEELLRSCSHCSWSSVADDYHNPVDLAELGLILV